MLAKKCSVSHVILVEFFEEEIECKLCIFALVIIYIFFSLFSVNVVSCYSLLCLYYGNEETLVVFVIFSEIIR